MQIRGSDPWKKSGLWEHTPGDSNVLHKSFPTGIIQLQKMMRRPISISMWHLHTTSGVWSTAQKGLDKIPWSRQAVTRGAAERKGHGLERQRFPWRPLRFHLIFTALSHTASSVALNGNEWPLENESVRQEENAKSHHLVSPKGLHCFCFHFAFLPFLWSLSPLWRII